MNQASCLELAVAVAKSRAEYLDLALRISASARTAEISADDISALTLARKRFEELREAFTAMERAIECGYVDVEMLKS